LKKNSATLALLNPELVLIMRQLGRVVVDANYRQKKWGHDLMREKINTVVNITRQLSSIGAIVFKKNFMKVMALCKQAKCI
jgi:ElaA protein